eukprot:118346-Hanusia_phi.AAC.2
MRRRVCRIPPCERNGQRTLEGRGRQARRPEARWKPRGRRHRPPPRCHEFVHPRSDRPSLARLIALRLRRLAASRSRVLVQDGEGARGASSFAGSTGLVRLPVLGQRSLRVGFPLGIEVHG